MNFLGCPVDFNALRVRRIELRECGGRGAGPVTPIDISVNIPSANCPHWTAHSWHLGLPTWKSRFPDARVFAPVQSIARVETKRGDVLLRVRSGGESAWYVTDVITNMPKVPPPPIGLIFKWTGRGPARRLNGVAPW